MKRSLRAALFLAMVSSPFSVRASDWFYESLPAGRAEAHEFQPFTESHTWERVLRGQDSIYDEPLATDRPDFTEASSTVGRGVLQIETGYTYIYDDEGGVRTRTHSAPETLFRYGILDNIELRLVWNYAWQDTLDTGAQTKDDGAEDLVVGTKLGLTSQEGLRPESALIIDMSTPTGGEGFTTQHAEYGMNYLYGWDLPNDKLLAGSFGYSTDTEFTLLPVPSADRFNVFHASVTHGFPIVEPIACYVEYFGLYVDGQSGGRHQHFINSGLTYLLNNNVQFDVRVGAGLNQAADDLFAGTGLSVRL